VSCGNRRRVVAIPVIVEPVVVPVPLPAVPVEVTDVEVAIRVAVVYKASSMTLLIEYPDASFKNKDRDPDLRIAERRDSLS
jgi:hypothetical protein